MLEPFLTLDGHRVPRFLYGTAWKEDDTQRLTELALKLGFRGIDTANQRRHYHEAAVGQGVATVMDTGLLDRKDVFLQTKFTFQRGQDERLPYDPTAPIVDQVTQSLERSLEHLRTSWVDSYLLHGPSQSIGLGDDDWQAWQRMETLHDGGQTRMLGISNVNLEQLVALWRGARVRPALVQNRCYAVHGWDRGVRKFCDDHGMVYQGFSLLTANRKYLAQPKITEVATRHGCTVAQLVFRFALQVGMIPLTGTTDPEHMEQDLQVFQLELTADAINRLEDLGISGNDGLPVVT